MNELIEERYFGWLCAKVEDARNSRSRKILEVLFRTEFVPLPEIIGDDNRAEDGKELRRQFLMEFDIPDDPEWRKDTGCSVFEMILALARRAEFVTDDPVRTWFWELVDNLGLRGKVAPLSPSEIEDKIYHFIWRDYDFSGDGGLFPLKRPMHDQREIEIWYQFNQYLIDQDR